MSDITTRRPLVIPALGGLYARLDTGAETLLRVVCGLALVAHGFPKIMNPFGAVGMVEGLGFYPAASPDLDVRAERSMHASRPFAGTLPPRV